MEQLNWRKSLATEKKQKSPVTVNLDYALLLSPFEKGVSGGILPRVLLKTPKSPFSKGGLSF